jgi:hypothetical protein
MRWRGSIAVQNENTGQTMIENLIIAEIHRYRLEHPAIYQNDIKIAEALRERNSQRPVLNPVQHHE